jgi:hypothetical protein
MNDTRRRHRVYSPILFLLVLVITTFSWFTRPNEAYVSSVVSSDRCPPTGLSCSGSRTFGATRQLDLLSVTAIRESSLDEQLANENHRLARTDAATRFNTDMLRVLKSRRGIAMQKFESSSSVLHEFSTMERRTRPSVLTHDIDGAVRVTSMLRHMVNIDVATEESYQIVLKALSDRGRLRWKRESSIICAADEVQRLMKELWERQNGNISTETCNLALQTYAACSTPRGNRRYAQKAQTLLDSMIENGIWATTKSFSHVVNAWAWQQGNLKGSKCAEMAQLNLDRMIELEPDVDTVLQAMDWVLEAWSKSVSVDAPSKADRILCRMRELNNGTSTSSFPSSQSYTNAILAWSKSTEEGSPAKAHQILFQLMDDYEDGTLPENVVPDHFAISKSVAIYRRKAILLLLLTLSVVYISIDGVISAWARVGKAERAEKVLWRANEVSKNCKILSLDVVTYNTIVHAYLRDGKIAYAIDRILPIIDYMNENKEEQPSIRPNCFTYHCILRAWEKSKDPNAAQKCVETLETMHRLWNEGDTSLIPKNLYYNMVINKLAKSNEETDSSSVMRIFHLLQGSPFCSPDIISYTSVIESFAKSNDPTAPERCLELFNEVCDLYQEKERSELKPNFRTYTMVLFSLTKNPTFNNVLQARKLLSELEERFENSKDPQLKPNTYPYNYVLNCAASCIGDAGEKLKAFQVATETYNTMRKSDLVNPDSYTYSFWIKAANNLLPKGELRRNCIALSFEQCRKEGLVNEAVLRRLLAGTPFDVIAQVLGTVDRHASSGSLRSMTLEDLPPQWSRNVK